jgi:hypothetical protein
LAGGHVAVRTATTCKQELAGPLVGSLQIIIYRLAGLLAQFKSDGPPGFFCRTVARSAVYPPAATSSTRMATTSHPRSLLSIARLNIARSRARPSIWSFVRIDQTCLGRSGGFAPVSLPFHGTRLWDAGSHSLDPAWPYSSAWLQRTSNMSHPLCRRNQVGFRTNPDLASRSAAKGLSRLTRCGHSICVHV